MRKIIYIAVLISLGLAAFLSPFASSHPDGLERVAIDKGFLQLSEGKEAVKSPIPNYVMPGVQNETAAGSLAGVFGTVLVFAAMHGFGKLFLKKSHRTGES